jgi:hypothetical protein
MRATTLTGWSLAVVLLSLPVVQAAQSNVSYPLDVTLDARTKTEVAAVNASVTISLNRLMEESRRQRVLTALKENGYPGFLTVLRSLPPVGVVRIGKREVEIKFAHEAASPQGRRLVLVADQPLFFLANDPDKRRAGYELTMVELTIDQKAEISGRMAGAARVKPGGETGVVLDTFGEEPVTLSGQLKR